MSGTIGVIGGSGLYEMEGLHVEAERRLETPWGEPSDAYVVGEIDGRRVAFLARHGRGHRILPTELNFRANVYGFKKLGVEFLISVSAVGSMKSEYHPGHIVVPDQFFDRTRHRPDTFFGNGLVAHTSSAAGFGGARRRSLSGRRSARRCITTALSTETRSRRAPSRWSTDSGEWTSSA
jgi:5'-methylthioadenosine phosphorylase